MCAILLSASLFYSNPISSQTATTQKPRPKAIPSKSRVELADWNELAEKSFGITEQGFKSMGLEKLTADEYMQVLAWETARETAAESKGMNEGRSAAEATTITYSCGREKMDEQSLSKVNLFVVDNESTPAEIMSRLRERLREISDVQIVFDKKESDLVIEVDGYEVKMEGETRTVGYAASAVVTTPCTWKVGAQSGDFIMYQDSFLLTSNLNASGLVERIVTNIDSHDIESARQENASLRKILQNQKK
jgi:hypothetical protein